MLKNLVVKIKVHFPLCKNSNRVMTVQKIHHVKEQDNELRDLKWTDFNRKGRRRKENK